METKLARIAQLSNENPNMVFTSVGHLIDRELLAKCHEEMDADKAEEKCRLIEFGRFAENNHRHRGEGKPDTFDFLGFTHICSHTGNGYFKVRRKTSRKKFIKKCKDIFRRIGQMRTMKTKEIIAKLNEILIGYYHYYGVYGNYPAVIAFRWHVLKSLFYWLNRRSQKKSYNWKGFLDMIKFGHPLARPKSFYVYI